LPCTISHSTATRMPDSAHLSGRDEHKLGAAVRLGHCRRGSTAHMQEEAHILIGQTL
jgi:hypothetical protein